MFAGRIEFGDTMGIVSPSWAASPDDYRKYIEGIEAKGFRVVTGRNIYKNTCGYCAGVEERISHFP